MVSNRSTLKERLVAIATLDMNASSCTDARSGMVLAEVNDGEEQIFNLKAGGSIPSCCTSLACRVCNQLKACILLDRQKAGPGPMITNRLIYVPPIKGQREGPADRFKWP